MQSGSAARTTLRLGALGLALSLVAACSHLHWPWHKTPPAPPVPVHEVDIVGAGLESAPQYWKRNTLLVDLSAASGTGSLTVKPVAGTTWPVRVALRVTPGAVQVLEVRGAERISLPVSASGTTPLDLELPPSVVTPKTPELTVNFGPAAPALQ